MIGNRRASSRKYDELWSQQGRVKSTKNGRLKARAASTEAPRLHHRRALRDVRGADAGSAEGPETLAAAPSLPSTRLVGVLKRALRCRRRAAQTRPDAVCRRRA